MVGQGQTGNKSHRILISYYLHYRFDTEGTFETASPVPALKLQLKLASKGIFKNDKILGKVHIVQAVILLYAVC